MSSNNFYNGIACKLFNLIEYVRIDLMVTVMFSPHVRCLFAASMMNRNLNKKFAFSDVTSLHPIIRCDERIATHLS